MLSVSREEIAARRKRGRLSRAVASRIAWAMRQPTFLATLTVIAPLLALLSGCFSPRSPAPAPLPVVTPTPTPRAPAPIPTGSDWRDWPVTPGDWAYRTDGRGTIALFGMPGADALLTLRCDRQTGMIYLSRQGAVTSPLTLRTTSTARVLGVQPTGGVPVYVAVAIAPRDALLDAMAFSRGLFIVEQAGAQTLVVPAWAEVGRVTEDCRR